MRRTSLRRAPVLLAIALCSCGEAGDPTERDSPFCRDELEANDQPGSATPLGAGSTGGLKACPGDVDWYQVSLAAGEQLDVAVRFGDLAESLAVTVHERSQGLGLARATTAEGGLAARVQPGAAGEYLIRVEGRSQERIGYQLELQKSPSAVSCGAGEHAQNGACVADGCDDLGLEPNDGFPTARPLAPGTYKGLRMCNGDVDYFVIDAPAGGGALNIVIDMPGADYDLYATDGTEQEGRLNIVGAAQTRGDVDYLMNVPMADGARLYLFVYDNRGVEGSYDLDVRFDPLDPARDCLVDCRTLVEIDGPDGPNDAAAATAGFYKGTLDKYLYGRRDFVTALKYAFAEVQKKYPQTKPLYLSDMGQADGDVPGRDVCGDPCARHPLDAHINGHDADIAYYSTLADNDIRIICGDGSDTGDNGEPGKYNDGLFCTTQENVIDWPRQAYFLAKMTDNPLYHVTGIDVTLPKQFLDAAQALFDSGDITASQLHRINNGLVANREFWPAHHHHIHLQLYNPYQPELPLTYEYYFLNQ
jgi:hypothetical protein